jgi:geranylgeranyl diphosphate synthase type I
VREPPAPPSLIAIGNRAAARIDALLAAEARRWETVDAGLVEPLSALRALVAAAGKRLRPAFVYWGSVAAGGDGASEAVVDAGAAVELLHTSALIHDDIIDASSRRRGLPCMHIDFADRHRQRQWRGDARRFGEGAAILVGDLAFVYADLLLRGAPEAAIDVFTDLRLEVNVGQYLDLAATASGRPSLDQARTICRYKSGKYTVERPLQLGAALAGRLEDLSAPLTAYGVALGEAFQLRDDLLGAFGDDRLLGKAVGEDFREGKPTALYAIAQAKATGASAALLTERFGRPDLTEGEVASIREVFISTGARAAVEQMVDGLCNEAVTALDDPAIVPEAARELLALAMFVTARQH